MNSGSLKVLMISSDRNVATLGSAVSERMKEYGSLVEELHIVLLSDLTHDLKEVELAKNVWVYPTNSSTSFLRPLDASRLGKRIVLEKKFVRGKSLITGDSIECGWAGLKVKRKWRIPLEVQIHSDPFSIYYSGFQNKVRRFFAKQVFSGADSVRVVTKDLQTKISSLTKAPVYVLPIYIDQEKIESGQISFDIRARYGWAFALLCVARLSPEKNLGMALEVLALVRKSEPNTGLVIVGSGTEESSLRAKAKALKLDGFVEFAGWQTDLASYYKTANIFLQTSFFEGYGLALVEAGLLGLPVVTTPVGIALELEDGHDALIYPIERVDLMAGGILELIEHREKRETLSFNLKRTLEGKLLSKEVYLASLKKAWEEVALRVRS